MRSVLDFVINACLTGGEGGGGGRGGGGSDLALVDHTAREDIEGEAGLGEVGARLHGHLVGVGQVERAQVAQRGYASRMERGVAKEGQSVDGAVVEQTGQARREVGETKRYSSWSIAGSVLHYMIKQYKKTCLKFTGGQSIGQPTPTVSLSAGSV